MDRAVSLSSKEAVLVPTASPPSVCAAGCSDALATLLERGMPNCRRGGGAPSVRAGPDSAPDADGVDIDAPLPLLVLVVDAPP